jgi:hypothetical protein
MANLCSVIMLVSFIDEANKNEKEKLLKKFEDEFFMDMECDSDYFLEEEEAQSIELNGNVKWSVDLEQLQKISTKFNVNIIGVGWEWGCGYVESYEINPEIHEEEL